MLPSIHRNLRSVNGPYSGPSRSSARLQLDVLVGSRERPTGDEAEPRLGHPRALRMDEAELRDLRVHRLVVHELLDASRRGQMSAGVVRRGGASSIAASTGSAADASATVTPTAWRSLGSR